jgi:hypothetical protein
MVCQRTRTGALSASILSSDRTEKPCGWYSFGGRPGPKTLFMYTAITRYRDRRHGRNTREFLQLLGERVLRFILTDHQVIDKLYGLLFSAQGRVIIFSDTVEEHIQHVRTILRLFRSVNLALSPNQVVHRVPICQAVGF